MHVLVAAAVLMVCAAGRSLAQIPSPCQTPRQFTGRARQIDNLYDHVNRYRLVYDDDNKRRALIEEWHEYTPGRQLLEFLLLANEMTMYEINLLKKTCTRVALKRPWRPFAIPANATFENEFYMGGPEEEIFAQEWSDRISLRKREYWLGTFSLKNCYPMSEVMIQDYEHAINSTMTTTFYDIVNGVADPNIFIPPPECRNAPWVRRPSRRGPYI